MSLFVVQNLFKALPGDFELYYHGGLDPAFIITAMVWGVAGANSDQKLYGRPLKNFAGQLGVSAWC